MATHDSTNEANRTASYTVVFSVDLTTPDAFSAPNVNGNQTQATLAAQRSTWIPAGFAEGCETRQVKHGDQITAYDDEAYYLKDKYLKSATNPNGILTIVSETT